MRWKRSKVVGYDSHLIALIVFLFFFSLRVFEKSQQYVKRFSRYKNPDAVRDKFESILN